MNSDETNPRPPEGNSIERPARRTDEARGPLPRGTPPKFGRYETWRVLGAGAFGRVYLAFDDLMERFVAIKAPKDALPADKHRAFLREARAISEIHHPHVCPVYDLGVEEDLPFLVMKFVRGGTLADLVEREPPTPIQALSFVEQIAQGLEAVHARGIIHRDLKPANVLYDEREKKLLLTDFGIARWSDGTETVGGRKGTPYYMAPEQWAPGGQFGDITARTDIYALGVMLFEFLTNARLFEGNEYVLMGQHCAVPPRKPSEVRSDLGSQYDNLCLKALSKKQTDRHASAKDLIDSSHALLRFQPQEREWNITVPGAWWKRSSRHPKIEWTRVTRTPASVTAETGMRYMLSILPTCEDSDLIGLAQLKGFPAFTHLDLWGCTRCTDEALANMKELTALTHLKLKRTQITGAGLTHLKQLAALTDLDLEGCVRLSDAGLVHLKDLKSLVHLDLSGCKRLTDKGCAHLKQLTSLLKLDLLYCVKLTDSGLANVQSLTALTHLGLGYWTRLTDAGLEHLKNLTKLQELDLRRDWYAIDAMQLSDAGLEHLKGLTALSKLQLGGCRRVTSAGIAALQAALPNCKIIR